jgi:hypothetical protein
MSSSARPAARDGRRGASFGCNDACVDEHALAASLLYMAAPGVPPPSLAPVDRRSKAVNPLPSGPPRQHACFATVRGAPSPTGWPPCGVWG